MNEKGDVTMRRAVSWCIAMLLAVAPPILAGQTAKSTSAKTAPASPVNLNTASETELEALPGIGPATAKKIISGRPYATAADLAKAGVPKSTIDKITPMVTAGAASAASGAAAKPAAAPPLPPPPAPAPPASTSTAKAATSTSTPTAAQQPPVKGMVWVNLSSKVYHKEGDRYYGNTKNGKFMNEDDAIKAGYRAAKTTTKKPS